MKTRYGAVVKLCAGCFLFFASGEARSGDTDIYESLPEVTIGRVFFSQQQRERLDQRRTATPLASGTVPRQVHKKNGENAAGYIVSSSGVSKVYIDGEFVTTSNSAAVTFPGAVKIARGEHSDEAEADDEAD